MTPCRRFVKNQHPITGAGQQARTSCTGGTRIIIRWLSRVMHHAYFEPLESVSLEFVGYRVLFFNEY